MCFRLRVNVQATGSFPFIKIQLYGTIIRSRKAPFMRIIIIKPGSMKYTRSRWINLICSRHENRGRNLFRAQWRSVYILGPIYPNNSLFTISISHRLGSACSRVRACLRSATSRRHRSPPSSILIINSVTFMNFSYTIRVSQVCANYLL